MSRAATRKPYRMPVPVLGGSLVVLAYSRRDAHRRIKNMSRHRLRRLLTTGTKRRASWQK